MNVSTPRSILAYIEDLQDAPKINVRVHYRRIGDCFHSVKDLYLSELAGYDMRDLNAAALIALDDESVDYIWEVNIL